MTRVARARDGRSRTAGPLCGARGRASPLRACCRGGLLPAMGRLDRPDIARVGRRRPGGHGCGLSRLQIAGCDSVFQTATESADHQRQRDHRCNSRCLHGLALRIAHASRRRPALMRERRSILQRACHPGRATCDERRRFVGDSTLRSHAAGVPARLFHDLIRRCATWSGPGCRAHGPRSSPATGPRTSTGATPSCRKRTSPRACGKSPPCRRPTRARGGALLASPARPAGNEHSSSTIGGLRARGHVASSPQPVAILVPEVGVEPTLGVSPTGF